jgi:N-formylglutamate deformylase
MTLPWLDVVRGTAPLVVSLPHTGTEIPPDIDVDLVDSRLARRDCDWWIERLYDFAADMGATVIRTRMSRTVIDVNRDPSGQSLYPGQATTDLVPKTTFDGDALWKVGRSPDALETERRKTLFFEPYHAAIAAEIAAARSCSKSVVLYDCHSIRSVVPRLFDGKLPQFNIGTNGGVTCAPVLQSAIADLCAASGFSHVLNGRFKGGYITRHHAAPEAGIHAVQMELACRGYMREPIDDFSDANWPTPYDPAYAKPLQDVLKHILAACLSFAKRDPS